MFLKKKILLASLLFFFCFSKIFAAQNSLSDSVDVKHYNINLNIDFTNSQINGSCDVKIFSLVNGLNYLPLDLEQLNVDSVKFNGANLVFNYTTPRLHINLFSTMNIGDSAATTLGTCSSGSMKSVGLKG